MHELLLQLSGILTGKFQVQTFLCITVPYLSVEREQFFSYLQTTARTCTHTRRHVYLCCSRLIQSYTVMQFRVRSSELSFDLDFQNLT